MCIYIYDIYIDIFLIWNDGIWKKQFLEGLEEPAEAIHQQILQSQLILAKMRASLKTPMKHYLGGLRCWNELLEEEIP